MEIKFLNNQIEKNLKFIKLDTTNDSSDLSPLDWLLQDFNILRSIQELVKNDGSNPTWYSVLHALTNEQVYRYLENKRIELNQEYCCAFPLNTLMWPLCVQFMMMYGHRLDFKFVKWQSSGCDSLFSLAKILGKQNLLFVASDDNSASPDPSIWSCSLPTFENQKTDKHTTMVFQTVTSEQKSFLLFTSGSFSFNSRDKIEFSFWTSQHANYVFTIQEPKPGILKLSLAANSSLSVLNPQLWSVFQPVSGRLE